MPINISGTTLGQSTKDATALPEDVRHGKIFYGAGGKYVGTHTCGKTLDACTNIRCIPSADSIEIYWTDPDDIIFNDKIISKWIGTKLVRKEGSYPKNESDGIVVKNSIIRNEHMDVAFKDNGTRVDVTYYYCLFPYTDKSVTESDSNRFIGKRVRYDSVLRNNTWSQIANASELGIASQLWKIGDEIPITFKTDWRTENINFQIADFNHFDKSDGSGKAGICFVSKWLTYTQAEYDTSNSTCDWSTCAVRQRINDFVNGFPDELKSVIKGVDAYSSSYFSKENKTTNNKVFIPSVTEINLGDDLSSSSSYGEPSSKPLPIFTDDKSRKKWAGGDGDVYEGWTWMTRSVWDNPALPVVNGFGLLISGSKGASYYLCLIFNV